MRPVALDEIVALDRYAALRPSYRQAVIRHKKNRRLPVGDKVTLVFEDHETLRFQIQEMVWIEQITDPAKIQDEIDVYNELMPGENELSATLFIEITSMPEIRPELDRLIGIDEHVALLLGEGAGEEAIAARFDPKQMEEDRISAVQYIRFRFDAGQARRFADHSLPAGVRIDHPNYRHQATIPEAVRESLCETLAGAPPTLLRVEAEGDAGPVADELLFETKRVRARRPAHPRAPGHVIVEPREAGASLLEADAELLAELLDALKRVAAEALREHGRCRVETELGPGAERASWHVLVSGS